MRYTKNDKLDYLIGLALSRDTDPDIALYDSLDTSDVVFSKDFCKKRDRIIRSYRYRPILQKLRTYAVRAAVCLLVLLLLATVTVAAIPFLRRAVLNAIVEWQENYITVRFEIPQNLNQSTSGNDAADSQKLPAISPPKVIREVRKPRYLPEGVVEDIVSSDVASTVIDYYSGNALVYSFQQSLLNDRNLYFDNTDVIISDITIRSNTGIMMDNTQTGNLIFVWNDGEYLYSMQSEICEQEELLLLAESVS